MNTKIVNREINKALTFNNFKTNNVIIKLRINLYSH